MKKKLLIFHPQIAPYRIDLFNSLYDAFETKVCLFNTEGMIFDGDKIYSQLLFKPIFLELYFKVGDSFFCKGYWQILDDFRPDIVIVGEFGIGAFQVYMHRLLKRKKYKIVSFCDDSYNMLAEYNDFSRIHRLARKFLTPRLDELVLVEPKAMEWYQKRYGKGFCFPIIRRDEKQREIYQRTLSLSQQLMYKNRLLDKNVFIYVGRFVALKNINRIIEAFSRLNHQENVLVLVGSGEEEQNIRDTAKSFGVTPLFTGRLEGDALYAWYNIADYFVLASWQEAFGAVTNEALLAGCYSLISKRAGSQCLIEEGENGFTFDPMDVDELHRKMVEVINRFPKKRPLDRVKADLMPMKYDESISGLIERLNIL